MTFDPLRVQHLATTKGRVFSSLQHHCRVECQRLSSDIMNQSDKRPQQCVSGTARPCERRDGHQLREVTKPEEGDQRNQPRGPTKQSLAQAHPKCPTSRYGGVTRVVPTSDAAGQSTVTGTTVKGMPTSGPPRL